MPYKNHHSESVSDKVEGFLCFTVNDAKEIFGMDTGNVDYTAITVSPGEKPEGELVIGLDEAGISGFGKFYDIRFQTNGLFAWNRLVKNLIVKLIQKYQQTGKTYLEPEDLSDEEIQLGRESRYKQKVAYYRGSFLTKTIREVWIEGGYDLTIVVLCNDQSIIFNQSGSIDNYFISKQLWGYSPSSINDEQIQAVYEMCLDNELI